MQNNQTIVSTLRKRTIVGVVIGHSLEWYDFMVFASFSVIISSLFFPAHTSYESLLMTTATLGVAFVARPVGGVLLGLYADRKGRKAALTLVIALMTLAMAIITFAPTHASIGIGAPLLIVLARLLQGFSAGGEFGSSTSLLVELAMPTRRGLQGSWQMAGQAIAILLAALIGALLSGSLSKSSIENWGWRIPFALGLLLGPVGFYLRRSLDALSTQAGTSIDEHATHISLGKILRAEWPTLVRATGIIVALPVSIYVLLSYLPIYTTMVLKLTLSDSFFALIVGCALLAVCAPIAGALSDRLGKRRVALASLLVTLVILYPLYAWLTSAPSLNRLIVVQAVVSICLAGYFGPYGALLAEQFPQRYRATCLSLAYNIAVTAFGGFAQVFVMWLTHLTGSAFAPIYYVMFGLSISIVSVATMKSKHLYVGRVQNADLVGRPQG